MMLAKPKYKTAWPLSLRLSVLFYGQAYICNGSFFAVGRNNSLYVCRLCIISEPEIEPSVKGETLLWIKCRRPLFCKIKADRVPAGIGGKTRSPFRVRRNVPAKREDAGVTGAGGWFAGEIRTAEPANTGTGAALSDGTLCGQGLKNLPET